MVALVLVAPSLLFLNWLFTSGTYTVVPEQHLLRRSADDFLHISWTVSRLKRTSTSRPVVCVLGGSSARESIVSGASLARRIRADGGPSVTALDLGSMNQNFAASWAIVDNLPATRGGVMLVGVNPSRFTPTAKLEEKQIVGRKLLLSTAALREYVSGTYGRYTYSRTILPGIAAYISSYISEQRKALRTFQLPTTQYRLHRYTVARQRTVAQKEAIVQRWLKLRAPAFRRNLDYNVAMLDALVKHARRRGYQVLILELPWNQDIIGDRYEWAQSDYRSACRRIAAEYGARYVDLNQRVQLDNGDFYDLFHLVGAARVRWETALAQEVAATLNASTAAASGGPESTAAAAATASDASVTATASSAACAASSSTTADEGAAD